ncbi:hypothetical protein [Actinoplanes subtropicus]|uniref:hypothetical protein n=1 Tax=Actinoplanes subtropicus TaxID=543632 RepID=UPI0004C4378C|nr:hypothetical protein [Actinoplanes subtropicus]
MAAITTTIQVERSADDVFAYPTDPTRSSESIHPKIDSELTSSTQEATTQSCPNGSMMNPPWSP